MCNLMQIEWVWSNNDWPWQSSISVLSFLSLPTTPTYTSRVLSGVAKSCQYSPWTVTQKLVLLRNAVLLKWLKKRRKLDIRSFQHFWTKEYGFVQQKDRVVCILCCEYVVCRTSSVQRHYKTKHQSIFKNSEEKYCLGFEKYWLLRDQSRDA